MIFIPNDLFCFDIFRRFPKETDVLQLVVICLLTLTLTVNTEPEP